MKLSQSLRELAAFELSGWKTAEVSWLFFCCAIVTILSWNTDTWIGILSALTGIANVILNGKGKLSTYLFGVVNVALYSYIAFRSKFYGTVMLYSCYFLPMNIYGFIAWSRHLDSEIYEVEKRRLNQRWHWLLAGTVVLITALGGLGLDRLQGTMPYLDAFVTALSIVAMAASVQRCLEQWILWIIADIVTAAMWFIEYSAGSSNIATLLMWILFVINGAIMYYRWLQEVKKREPQLS
ncbi:nicotinamide mononucleotide transporter [bacterium]|nr:nicotinamide mononucleotide transporter [bacterium]